jgi:hypothetical protein
MSSKDQAILFLALTPDQSDTSSLKEYFVEQERRSLERWRVTLAKQKSVRQAQTSRTIGDLQDLFVDLVKNQALVIHDCLLCCLFYSTAAKKTACTWRRRSWPTPSTNASANTSTNLVRAELLYSSAFLRQLDGHACSYSTRQATCSDASTEPGQDSKGGRHRQEQYRQEETTRICSNVLHVSERSLEEVACRSSLAPTDSRPWTQRSWRARSRTFQTR